MVSTRSLWITTNTTVIVARNEHGGTSYMSSQSRKLFPRGWARKIATVVLSIAATIPSAVAQNSQTATGIQPAQPSASRSVAGTAADGGPTRRGACGLLPVTGFD